MSSAGCGSTPSIISSGRVRFGVRAEAARIEHVAARFRVRCSARRARCRSRESSACRPSVTKTLPGFRSECTMPLRCAYARPSAMPRMIGSATSRLDALAAFLAHHRVERAALQQLHRHVDGIAVAVEVEHRDDVRMRERLRLARLALQSHERLRMALEIRVQHFQRDARIRVARFFLAAIDRAEHDAHAAFAEQGLEHEALLDDRARLERTVMTFAGVVERADQAIRHHLGAVRTGERRRLQRRGVGGRPGRLQRRRVGALRSRWCCLQGARSGVGDLLACRADRRVRIDGRWHHFRRRAQHCLLCILRRSSGSWRGAAAAKDEGASPCARMCSVFSSLLIALRPRRP